MPDVSDSSLKRKAEQYGDGYDVIYQYSSFDYIGVGREKGKPVYEFTVLGRYGFRIHFCDTAGQPLMTSGAVVYNYKTPKKDASGNLYYDLNESTALSGYTATDLGYGNIIGWSTVKNDYNASTLSGVFVKQGGTVTFEKFGEAAKGASNSTLKLYPVANRAEANPSVSMQGYILTEAGNVPSYATAATVTKDAGDTRTYTVTYYPAQDGEPVPGEAGSTTLPTTSGEYVAYAHADATDTVIGADGSITSRGFIESGVFSEAFTVTRQASGTVKAKKLSYTGEAQALVEVSTTAVGGTFVYGEEEGGPFITTVPTAKAVGDYKVFYKVKGAEGYEDTGVEMVDVTISPKTLTLAWSNTAFDRDGKTHCPTAKITGVISGEDCTVNVSGAQKEAGTYKATATLVGKDAGNYKLPENSTIPYTIHQKKEGSANVSMGDFTFGGKATTPVVTSATHDVSTAQISYKSVHAPEGAYTAVKPVGEGTYTVRVYLPENEKYRECYATTTYTVSYLPVPDGSYEMKGVIGDGGWYTSEVMLNPGEGYEISMKDRVSFTSSPIKLTEEMSGTSFFIRKTDTGEQTGAITVSSLKIDTQSPEFLDMEEDGLYFSDEDGHLFAFAKDKNFKKAYVDGREVSASTDKNGNIKFELPVGKKRESIRVRIVDEAGNEKNITVITAPGWMKTGVVGEGEYYLEPGYEYKLPDSGSSWSVSGRPTNFMPGITFFAKNEGDHTFVLNGENEYEES